jgi:hypothetical protein
MKKFTPVLAFMILSLMTIPLVSSAAFNLIVCDGVDVKCDVGKLIELFKNLITALVEIATVITVIALIYMGITLMTSAGKPQARTDVKNRAIGILKGYVLILAAWLIVYTILKVLVEPKFILLTP